MGEPSSNSNDNNHDNDMFYGYTEIINGSDEMNNVTEIAHGDGQAFGAEATQPSTSRGRPKKSAVWEHFTVVADATAGCKRACCNHCKRNFAYSSGTKNSGTSHLTRHITDSCPAIKGLQLSKKLAPFLAGGETENGGGGTAEQPSKRRCRYTGAGNASFNQERSCSDLAKMVILHDYPLHIVEQPGFLSFVQGIQPRFMALDVRKMEAEVCAVYQRERDNLQQRFEAAMPGRISLIVGSWTTCQTLGYVSLTGQFIDSEWNLHRRMLNFMVVPRPSSEYDLSEAISASLAGWNMADKLLAVTLDQDCSSHGTYSANLQYHLTNKIIHMFDGQLFTVRCFARVLNAIAQDVLASINTVIYNIRESIKFIKVSSHRENQFAEIVLQLGIRSTKTLCLDITTEWNTTYLMLLAALDYRQVFSILEIRYDEYNEAPSTEDWRKAEAACIFLKLLYDSAQSVMKESRPNPTANIFFHEAYVLQHEFVNLTAHQDPAVSTIAKCIRWRPDNYWNDCNLVLAIAVVMDPRFRMIYAEYTYCKIYGAEEGPNYVKVLDDVVHELYRAYAMQTPLLIMPPGDEQVVTNRWGVISNPASPSFTGNGAPDYGIYHSGNFTSQPVKSELDRYLAEELTARTPEFDVLNWWRLNNIQYPTLSRMARDVLAIPVSTACSVNSMFSAATGAGARMLDDYRSSLHPEILEALFCGKDWLQCSLTVTEPCSTA